jgi:pimeloyl-ACP methyl ester carboxylesterase
VPRIAYRVAGPDTDNRAIFMAGWPDDTRTWDRILPALHESGWRTVTRYLRGFGATRFKDVETMRSGQLSALGCDVLNFADARSLERFTVIGHAWGARAANR